MLANKKKELALAVLAAKKRQQQKDDAAAGTGTGEAGPQVQTNAPPNEWPTDGDFT